MNWWMVSLGVGALWLFGFGLLFFFLWLEEREERQERRLRIAAYREIERRSCDGWTKTGTKA